MKLPAVIFRLIGKEKHEYTLQALRMVVRKGGGERHGVSELKNKQSYPRA